MHLCCSQYLEVAIKGNSITVLVAGGQRHKEELLAEGRSRGNWTTFASFQTCDVLGELGIHHSHLAMLDHVALQGTEDLLMFTCGFAIVSVSVV